ncbi:RNA-directed DNA polymerase, eukaryota [Tanacetum coccineum]
MHHHNGSYIMFGDMNAVRNAQERFSRLFLLVVVLFWMNKAGTKLSKLDRFLISEDVTIRLPDVRITALDRLWSDHNPILLHIDKTDFGPTSFKLYNSWLLRDGFDNLIKEEWELLDSNLKCHEKFRRLKDKIKQWSNNIKTLERNRKIVALEEINSIEKRIDEGSAMPSDNDHRLILLQEIEKIDKFASMDIIQKAHVKWDIEGIENYKTSSMGSQQKKGGHQDRRKTLKTAVGNGLITGVNIKNSTINVSHLFYADDVIITTDWNAKDMDNIIRVLHMEDVVDTFSYRLSLESNLSVIGGSPDSYKSVLVNQSFPGKKKEVSIHLVCSELSRAFGANIVGNLQFYSLERSVLLITPLFLLDLNLLNCHLIPKTIESAISWSPKVVLKSMESIRRNFFNGIRDGECLKFANLFIGVDIEVCSVAAKMSAPFVSSLRRDVRGGEESAQLSRISDLLDTVVLSNMGDRRFWDLNGDGCFRVKDVRRLLDDMLLPKSDVPSRWVKQIPIKVNVLAWKISMDRLPTRVNLHRRGVQVSPISCPICCEALENLDHLLFCCDLAKDIARFNQVQNKCWKECFTLPGGVSGHIETISSSLIQIFEKMVFLKT